MRQIPVGLDLADIERDENALYYGCRTDPADELESTEWYGVNTYLHCDGSATSIDQLTGYQTLLSDFTRYDLSYPVMLTEFGCLNPSFPTQDGFAAQRTWLDIDALFSSDYREEFAGGFVFEYSTEKVNAEADSPYPFNSYGPGNYGVGYFAPEDCDDINIPCEFVRFPQFNTLAAKFESVDVSGEPALSGYTPPAETVPDCPATFYAVSAYTWPADNIENLVCWGDGGFTCPNTSCESTPTQPSQTNPAVEPSTLSPGSTAAPSKSSTEAPSNVNIRTLPPEQLSSGGCRLSQIGAIFSTACVLLVLFYG
jgi:1,3-beta-glucanosyltransferase GAS5